MKIRKRSDKPKKKASQREVHDTELGYARRELEGLGYDVSEWSNKEVRELGAKLADLDELRGLQKKLDDNDEKHKAKKAIAHRERVHRWYEFVAWGVAGVVAAIAVWGVIFQVYR